MKKCYGIYEIKSSSGRSSYKIFATGKELEIYLQKNKDKICESMKPIFISEKYREFKNTQVRKLAYEEVQKYMLEKMRNES